LVIISIRKEEITMYENKWKRRGKKERDRVCGCSIEIENSIVIIICGEVDSLPQALNSALET
jgi:N-acetylneuraminic acid mutarotase